MRIRSLPGLLGLVLFLPGCGAETDVGEEAAALPIGGMYEVTGLTVATESGRKREIAGTLILAEDGDSYTATFNLNTTYPGADQALPAEVIGKGEGKIHGRTLKGTAETQLVMATVPGIDPGFAYIPRMVSTRIASTTTATITPDGTVSIEIENEPAPGADYSPTRTTLRGARVSAAGLGGGALHAESQAER
jgi:hypothetical protein